MRILLFLAIFCACPITWADGISPDFSRARFSPSFGLMLTDFAIGGSSVALKTTPEVGYSIGVNLYVPSESDYVDYLSGLYYWSSKTRVESEVRVGGVDVYQDSLIEVNRISLPVVAKVYPFQKEIGIYTRAGLINHFLLNVNQETTVTTSTGGEVNTQNFITDENNYESYFLDASVGLGFETSIGRYFGFFIEFNYLYGVTPIIKGDQNVRTSTYYTSFGIGF